jgi:hypothetical protein
MRVGQAELAALVEVALEAGLGRLARIDDGSGGAPRLHVQAAGAMAGLAARVADLGAGKSEPRVGRARKVVGLVGMALRAFLASDVGRSRNSHTRRHNGALDGLAGNEEKGPEHAPPEDCLVRQPASRIFHGEDFKFAYRGFKALAVVSSWQSPLANSCHSLANVAHGLARIAGS